MDKKKLLKYFLKSEHWLIIDRFSWNIWRQPESKTPECFTLSCITYSDGGWVEMQKSWREHRVSLTIVLLLSSHWLVLWSHVSPLDGRSRGRFHRLHDFHSLIKRLWMFIKSDLWEQPELSVWSAVSPWLLTLLLLLWRRLSHSTQIHHLQSQTHWSKI